MFQHTIIRIDAQGGVSTVTDRALGSNPTEALRAFATSPATSGHIREGDTYLVYDALRNSNGRQGLFQWGRKAPLEPVPVGLSQ